MIPVIRREGAMKSSSGSKGDQMDIFITEDMTRREFLRTGVGLAAVASGLEVIAGCVTTEIPKATTLVYPPLPYNKIQPPQEGCLVGFFKEPETYAGLKDSGFIPQNLPEIEASRKTENFQGFLETLKKEKDFGRRGGYQIGNEINYVEKALGTKPFIFSLPWPKLYSGFPVPQVTQVAKKGIVPYVYAALGSFDSPTEIPGFGPKGIARGQHDGFIKKFAAEASGFGKEYGGFFITTMEEMNGNWFSWGMNANFIAAWRHMWQIFEDQGVNHYATWVWVVYCPEGLPTRMVDDPELYYPGDRYVDWVGFCAYSIAGNQTVDQMLNVLIDGTYRRFLKKHPQKPIMISSFGRTNETYQSNWLINAYRSIKKSFPAIKAVIYHDNTWRLTGDHTLNPKSWQTLKEVFKDPYWIMAK
jgi:Glycosyl hydrolase family 26